MTTTTPLIQLRPHHLLCMLTYVGEGYSTAFKANFNGIIKKMKSGAIIQIVTGPDDICKPRLSDDSQNCHCANAFIDERDKLAKKEITRHLFGDSADFFEFQEFEFLMDQNVLDKLREGFLSGSIRSACELCQWQTLCDDIAAEGFKDSRLDQICPAEAAVIEERQKKRA